MSPSPGPSPDSSPGSSPGSPPGAPPGPDQPPAGASGPAIEQAAAVLGPRVRRNVPLGPHTTYRVGGPAALFVAVDDDATLADVSAAVRASGVTVLVVGRGSNLLVADTGFRGLAVVLGEHFTSIDVPQHTERGSTSPVEIVAGGAASLPVVARRTAAAGLTGFEWAVGVPGSIGGAVFMNAGGHGSDMARSLVGVRVLDLVAGEDGWVPAAALDLSYRHSNLTSSHVVLAARLALEPGDRGRSEAAIAEIVRWRRAHQPGGANAGSVFTNPAGDSAGRLIDAAGCKGLRIGTAEVSFKHANFVQADEHGRAADVLAVMDEVRRRVEAHSGVRLEAETRLVGFDDPRPPVEAS